MRSVENCYEATMNYKVITLVTIAVFAGLVIIPSPVYAPLQSVANARIDIIMNGGTTPASSFQLSLCVGPPTNCTPTTTPGYSGQTIKFNEDFDIGLGTYTISETPNPQYAMTVTTAPDSTVTCNSHGTFVTTSNSDFVHCIVTNDFITTPSPVSSVEDCISFNPQNTAVMQATDGRWKVTDGSSWILDFGSNQAKAIQSMNKIKDHGFNSQCFVGNPVRVWVYYLVDGHSPSGPNAGEDCLSINLQSVAVVPSGNRWEISDGSHLIATFDLKSDAEQALSVMKTYNFDYNCFFDRPAPDAMKTYYLPEFPFAMIILLITIGGVVGFSVLIHPKMKILQ